LDGDIVRVAGADTNDKNLFHDTIRHPSLSPSKSRGISSPSRLSPQ
jgi:hypothetical protein